MRKQNARLQGLLFGALIATTALLPGPAGAQTNVPLPPQLTGSYLVVPWDGAGRPGAKAQAAQSTIMSTYSIKATKDGATYAGTIVGTSPFAITLTSQTIDVVVVPVIVNIGSKTFDPTVPDTCDGNVSALTRFKASPLAQNVANLTFNGVNVGNTQFTNGFRRAEFFQTIKGSPAYQNTLSFTYSASYTLSSATVGSHGATGTISGYFG